MKNLLLLLVLTFTLSCCNKDDDPQPISEIDKLPAATQIGADTFGCLLDGEAFLPGNGNNSLDCVYQYVGGNFYFALQANKRDKFNNRVTIALATNSLQIKQGFTYELLENTSGNSTGIYSYAANTTYTSSIHFGKMQITKIDEINQFVSGTFWFNILDYQGNIHKITEGRFDIHYTN